MKRLLLVTLAALALTACVSSKDYSATDYLINADGFIEIAPGKGLADIQLGMTEEEAIQILGLPQEKLSLAEERKGYDYMDDNYSTRTFDTGFDYVFLWYEATDAHPIFKLFITNGIVSEIKFSHAHFPSSRTKLYRIAGTTLTFGSDEEEIEQQLGPNEKYYAVTATMYGHTSKVAFEWEYHSKGISIISLQGEIQAIDIYTPMQ